MSNCGLQSSYHPCGETTRWPTATYAQCNSGCAPEACPCEKPSDCKATCSSNNQCCDKPIIENIARFCFDGWLLGVEKCCDSPARHTCSPCVTGVQKCGCQCESALAVATVEAGKSCGCQGSFVAQPAAPPAPGCQSCKSGLANNAAVPQPNPTMTIMVPYVVDQQSVSNYETASAVTSGPSLPLEIQLAPSAPTQPAPGALPQLQSYAHSSDYTTLTGKLYFSPRTRTWLLRYIPVEEEDQYGGVMTLVGIDPSDRNLRAGLTVTVRGRIADPNTSELSPAYLLQEIRVVAE